MNFETWWVCSYATLALQSSEIKQERGRVGMDLTLSQVQVSSSVNQDCPNSLQCWKSTAGSWNPSGQWGGSVVTTLKITVCAALASPLVLWIYITHRSVWVKENMEQNWAGTCCSLNSVWHCPFYFLLIASCLGIAKYYPSTCSFWEAHDVLYLHAVAWAWVLAVPAPVKGFQTELHKIECRA